MPQEHARFRPVSLHRPHGDAECLRDLVLGESTEEAALHHLRQPRLQLGKPIHGFVQLEERLGLVIHGDLLFVQRDALLLTTALEPHARLRAVHEHVTHRHGRQREEVRTVSLFRSRVIHELQIRFVHEPGRLQRPATAAHGKLPMRDRAKLLVDQRQEPIE